MAMYLNVVAKCAYKYQTNPPPLKFLSGLNVIWTANIYSCLIKAVSVIRLYGSMPWPECRSALYHGENYPW